MIRWKDGRPIVEIYDPAVGRKRHVRPAEYDMSLRGLTGRALERAARRLEHLALEAVAMPASRIVETCDSFASRWPDAFPGRGERARDESTREHNRERATKFGADFAGRPLGSIEREEAVRWAQKHPSRLAAVRAMYNDAIDAGIVETNPFARLGMAQSKGRKDIVVLTRDEIHTLADVALRVHGRTPFGHDVAAAILWAAYTCVRPGEVYASRHSLLAGDTYDLRSQYSSRLRRETKPKHGSDGIIYVPPGASEAIAAKPRRVDDDLMFRTARGRQFSAASWLYSWEPVRTTFVAGLPKAHELQRRLEIDPKDKLDLHELRHFGASHMLNDLEVEPWVIAAQLRHQDGGALVLSLYGHPSRREAISRMRRAYGQNVTPLRDVSDEARGRKTADGS